MSRFRFPTLETVVSRLRNCSIPLQKRQCPATETTVSHLGTIGNTEYSGFYTKARKKWGYRI